MVRIVSDAKNNDNHQYLTSRRKRGKRAYRIMYKFIELPFKTLI